MAKQLDKKFKFVCLKARARFHSHHVVPFHMMYEDRKAT